MKTLNEIYAKYQYPDGHGDKGTAHTYIDEYEKLLRPYRNNATILEIGLAYGESLCMWHEYFTNSKIVGIDIQDNEIKPLLEDPRFDIIIADATKQEVLSHIEQYTFDVVIDDGSHALEDQVASFNILKNKMKPGGLYIIEDVFDIDSSRELFESLHSPCAVVDNRFLKNRSDDVLILYKF